MTGKDPEKYCNKCSKTKPLSEFYRNARTKDGHQAYCKDCMKEQQHLWRLANRGKHQAWCRMNREKRQATQNTYRLANPEKVRAGQLRRKYGISLADYDEMLEEQDNGCAICGKTPEENGRRLDVDHNHDTGKVRGLLCSSCNRLLGYVYEDPELLRAAARYLRR